MKARRGFPIRHSAATSDVKGLEGVVAAVLLDEGAARCHLVAHQQREHVARLRRILPKVQTGVSTRGAQAWNGLRVQGGVGHLSGVVHASVSANEAWSKDASLLQQRRA